ncbi:hypothetical protein Acsp01_27390 [Actinoplanes sp. NBRC 101535]|nr:hypothetical protein Acsp01_27390 [Actinoplanes sp. NBRC 101535]
MTGVFVAIGHDPRSELFKGKIELDDEGYVKGDSPSTRTHVAGVFATEDAPVAWCPASRRQTNSSRLPRCKTPTAHQSLSNESTGSTQADDGGWTLRG